MRDRQAGFTLTEIMIALLVMMVGLAGVMSMQRTAMKANQSARRIDRARMIAEQTIEEQRSRAPTVLTNGTTNLADMTTVDGVTYHRSIAIVDALGNTALALITVDVSYGEEGDESDLHHVRLQLVRTRTEAF
jgi:prepilin-type N-terminal cleavage/methylation domain-containing protein